MGREDNPIRWAEGMGRQGATKMCDEKMGGVGCL